MNGPTRSLWMDEAAPRLDEWSASDNDVDVCIVGAGIAGVSIALSLAQAGRPVLVLDRATVGAGETGRTSAHLASALDDRFYRLEHWHGENGARLAAQSHAAAIDLVEDWIARYDIECDFRRVPGYLVRAPESREDVLDREFEAALRAGCDVARLADGLPSLPPWGAVLRFGNQARFHPLKYLFGLHRAAVAAGVRFARADVREIEDGARPRVATADGGELRANAVVVATNVPFHRRVTLHTKQAAYRTFVLAAPIPAGAMPDALIWDTADPYRYVRLHPDTRTGKDWLIVGGADHKTGQATDSDPFEELRGWAARYCDAVADIPVAWSGQIIEPVDGLAFIGRDPGAENVYVVSGDSGNGLTHGTLAAPLITGLIRNGAHEWQALYDPARKRLNGEWIDENANVALQYRDWLVAGDRSDAALARGRGAIVRHGLHRFAVYRADDGTLQAFSARCPHLGCAVRWNAGERSWDCPCHGSRFAASDGRVLNGPAQVGLEPLTERQVDGLTDAA